MKQRIYFVTLFVALIGAIVLCYFALPGCASQPVAPTTQPTTQPAVPAPTPDEQAYSAAVKVNALVQTALNTLDAAGVFKPAQSVAIHAAEDAVNKVLASWGQNLNQPLNVKIEADFYALLPDLTSLLAQGKAQKAAAAAPVH